MRKTRRGHVLCYPKVVRWPGQATPRCPVLLQWGRTRAGTEITHTGLAVQISNGRITQNRLSGSETRANNSWLRVSNTQITQMRSEMRGSSSRITQTGLPGLRQAEILKKLKVALPGKGQLHSGARELLPRHRGVGCRRCIKECWLRRGKKSNMISSLTG
jgi:hypothetical protein